MFPDYLSIYLQTNRITDRVLPFSSFPMDFNILYVYSSMIQDDFGDGDWPNMFLGDYPVAPITNNHKFLDDFDNFFRDDYDNESFANTFPLFQRMDYLDFLFAEPLPPFVAEFRGWYCSARNLSIHFQNHVARHLNLQWLATFRSFSQLEKNIVPLPIVADFRALRYLLFHRQIVHIWDLLGIPPFECSYFGPGF